MRAPGREAGRLLAAALLCLLPACNGRVERVRVMTYNIHHGATADERLDLAAIASVIRAQGVDVVGLQEVDRHWSGRSAFADQAAELADRLGMTAYFAPIYDLEPGAPGAPRRQYGLAVLSRFPMVDQRNLELVRSPTTGAAPSPLPLPGFPMVALDVRGVTLLLFDTHLDFRPDPAVRRLQVADMLRQLKGRPTPLVLLGDFNAPPDAPELAPLHEALLDVWMARGVGPGHTYPAAEPAKRIDAIFVSRDVRVLSATVPDAHASDHRPVVAELELPSR